MKLNCGPTQQEKQHAHDLKRWEERNRLEQWHRHFALFPVRIGSGECRWLEVVERRGTDWSWWNDCHSTWEYRPCK